MTVQFRPNAPNAVLPLEGICQFADMPLAVRRHPRVWDPPSTAHINHMINEAGLTEVGELLFKVHIVENLVLISLSQEFVS